MIILLTVIAAVIVGVPLAAVALVTVASRREDTARSIAGQAPGPLTRAARRVLAFHAVGISRPGCRVAPRGLAWQDDDLMEDDLMDDDLMDDDLMDDDLAPADDLALVGGGRPRT
jgi:hypothetical protein